jgi:hypothetical protein
MHALGNNIIANNLVDADQAALQVMADMKSSTSDATMSQAKLDEIWVQIQHKRILRFSMLIAGTNPDSENPLFHRLDPIL